MVIHTHAAQVVRGLVLVALLAPMLGLLPACKTADPGATNEAPPGSTGAPRWLALDGTEHDWSPRRTDGRTSLLVFSTTWCDECRREQPELEAWSLTHADDEQLMMVVSGSGTKDVARMIAERQLDARAMDIVVDPTGSLAAHYNVRATPTLIRLKADGTPDGTWTRITFVPPPGHASRTEGGGTGGNHSPPESGGLPPSSPGSTIDGLRPVADSGRELGTTYDIVVLADDPAAAARDLAMAREMCHTYEASLSEWRADSEISQINAHAAEREMPLTLPGGLEMLRAALSVSAATGGAFDITWKPLGELWDRAAKAGKAPEPADLLKVMEGVGYKHVVVSDTGVRFTHPGTKIGIAGFAKGWIIDRLFMFLRGKGYTDIIVNIGGDLRACGRAADGRLHRLRIIDPYHPDRSIGELGFGLAASVATSGNYLRYREIDGQRVGHIVDPRLGFAPLFDGSVTVLTRDCAMADALATALFVMGPDDGLEFIKQFDNADAVFVTSDGVRSSLPDADLRHD
ncbi:MAG: FAD:protein FMN transferase [Planctomycetota bacterium]